MRQMRQTRAIDQPHDKRKGIHLMAQRLPAAANAWKGERRREASADAYRRRGSRPCRNLLGLRRLERARRAQCQLMKRERRKEGIGTAGGRRERMSFLDAPRRGPRAARGRRSSDARKPLPGAESASAVALSPFIVAASSDIFLGNRTQASHAAISVRREAFTERARRDCSFNLERAGAPTSRDEVTRAQHAKGTDPRAAASLAGVHNGGRSKRSSN